MMLVGVIIISGSISTRARRRDVLIADADDELIIVIAITTIIRSIRWCHWIIIKLSRINYIQQHS